MHIETDVLCLLLLCAISYQSLRSVNQQTNRLLFRRTVYGVIAALGLDMLRALIDGRVFPGAVPLNRVLNMLYLDAGILLVCAWHLYVLERLRVSIRRRRIALMMCPAAIFVALNFASLWTEWVFGITDGNLFFRGRLFWIHPALLLGVMFASLVRIHITRATKGSGVDRRQAFKFTSLFLIPIAGTLLSLEVCGKTVSGQTLRTAFSLRSPAVRAAYARMPRTAPPSPSLLPARPSTICPHPSRSPAGSAPV